MGTKSEINTPLKVCVEDIRKIAESGTFTLDAQVRAYDLLTELLDDESVIAVSLDKSDIILYLDVYSALKEKVEEAFDQTTLVNAAKARLAPLERACTDARFEAAAAASLHEFAKETFETWQTAGIFMRKRALKALRDRAGFKLESHRIGNYVAKTFDLMNEANAEYARAQQRLFKADASYKVKPGLYARLAEVLSTARFDSRTEG
jgi:hypothetical protein